MSFFDDPLNLILLIPIIFMFMLVFLLGYLVFPFNAETECFPYENEGYNTKIVPQAVAGYECWIEHKGKFVPIRKWLAVNGVD